MNTFPYSEDIAINIINKVLSLQDRTSNRYSYSFDNDITLDIHLYFNHDCDEHSYIVVFYKNDLYHRENNLPAIIDRLSNKNIAENILSNKNTQYPAKMEYYVRSMRHRTNGPAKLINNRKDYYLHDDLHTYSKYMLITL